MKHLYDRFASLHAHLSLTNPNHVRELVDWYQTNAERELGLDPAMIRPDMARINAVAERQPPPAAPVWMRPPGPARDVTVIGYLRTASGVGEVGRQTLRTLQAGNLAVEGCDVALNVAAGRDDSSSDDLLVQTSSAPVQVFNINADQLPLVVAHLAPQLRPDALRINIPFWELSRFPAPWLPGLAEMDEIWAPSRFIAHALDGLLETPVIHMPVAMELPAVTPMPRSRLRLPEDRFLFFFAFDFLSFIERKNPAGAVAAFREAFPLRGTAGLVLKCMNGAVVPEKLARFRAEISGDPDIYLIDETLSRDDTLSLIACTDAVVSLHRSEGLGLLIAEAMLLSKPVIATDYSASRDLLSAETGYPVAFELVPVPPGAYPFSEGQEWAAPDIIHAASLMRRLVEAPWEASALVERARIHMQTKFSYKAVGLLQAERLRALLPDSRLKADDLASDKSNDQRGQGPTSDDCNAEALHLLQHQP
jgi:glycosyltransferase involved in cell wall biosynthesis